MRKLAAVLILLSWLLSHGAEAAPATVRQVFLVQNSGWMEPFYRDPRSKFRLLISSLVGQSNLQGVDVTLATFNQDGQVAGEASPKVLFNGAYDAGRIDSAIKQIDLPRKSSGAYADADFHGALKTTISQLLGGGEGVIWMLTNNKDSPNNSQTVVENTHDFYTLLRSSPYITRIFAFPIRDDLSGPNFHEKGFIIYAFAYGDKAAQALDVILRDGSPARALFRSPPVKIKPLGQDPVELRLTSPQAGGSVTAAVNNKVLQFSHFDGGRPIVARLHGVLHNTYYPQNIDLASVAATWRPEGQAAQTVAVALDPNSITKVPALGESAPVSLNLSLPQVPRSGPLFGVFDNHRVLRGELDIHLSDLQFSLDPTFVERISAISGGGDVRDSQAQQIVASELPAVFLDYKRVSSATTRVPVEIDIDRSPAPLIVLLSMMALLFAAAVAFAVWSMRARTYSIPVGGGVQTVTLRPFERRVVSDAYGTRAYVSGAVFGPPNVRTIADDQKS